MGRDDARGVSAKLPLLSHPKQKPLPMTVAEAPRRIAQLCRLPRSLRYRLALDVGLAEDEVVSEEEFLRIPTMQQASVLARLLKEHDENTRRSK